MSYIFCSNSTNTLRIDLTFDKIIKSGKQNITTEFGKINV